MTSVTFTVGAVRGKGRPRFTKHGIAYNSKEDKAYESMVRAEYRKQCGNKSFGSSPVAMLMMVQRCLPKSKPRRVMSEPDTIKPDVDNLLKSVMDALNGVAYDDDKQIVDAHVIKLPRVRDVQESVTITLKEVGYEAV